MIPKEQKKVDKKLWKIEEKLPDDKAFFFRVN